MKISSHPHRKSFDLRYFVFIQGLIVVLLVFARTSQIEVKNLEHCTLLKNLSKATSAAATERRAAKIIKEYIDFPSVSSVLRDSAISDKQVVTRSPGRGLCRNCLRIDCSAMLRNRSDRRKVSRRSACLSNHTFEVAGHGKKTRGHLKTNERWVQDLPVCQSTDVALLLC